MHISFYSVSLNIKDVKVSKCLAARSRPNVQDHRSSSIVNQQRNSNFKQASFTLTHAILQSNTTKKKKNNRIQLKNSTEIHITILKINNDIYSQNVMRIAR